MKSYRPDRIAPTSASVTPAALLSGWRSYVATFGLDTSLRSSPGHGASTPPLKKYVTWAYFSVSATWNCDQPCSLKVWANERDDSGPKATWTGRPSSYAVSVTTSRSRGAGRPLGLVRSKPADDASASACVSWRARS